MILKRLIEILKTFDKTELRRFERFVRSDYFNTNESVWILLKSLKKFHPAFDKPTPTQESLFKNIYGSRKFNEKTFRYLLSELYGLTGKFISISTVEADKRELKMKLADGMISRRLFSQARALISNIEKDVDTGFLIGDPYIHNKMSLSLLWHRYFYNSNSQNPDMNKSIEGGEYQIYNTIIELSNIYLSLISMKNLHNITYENNLIFAFIRNFNFSGMLEELENIEKAYSDKNKKRLLNAFKIYLCFMITFMNEKDEKYFNKMRKLVDMYGNLFNKTELRDIYVLLSSCCYIKKKAIDNERYLRHSFEIKKYALSKDLYHAEHQKMTYTSFFSILDTSLALNELKWADNFVNKYVSEISPQIRNDVYNYSIAELNFRRKSFENTLDYLSKVTYKYSLIKLRVRRLMLMTFYELDYFNEAYLLIDSYSHFLNNNKKITRDQKEGELNFLSYTKEILKIKEKPEKSEFLRNLQNKIVGNNLLSSKEWLLEKTIELI